jgi:glycine cleavage system aminomethyltransferase T
MSLSEQLAALREGAAVAVPGLRAVVAVRGPDAADWLERLCSAPVKDLPEGCGRWATLMDGKGKLRADLRVVRLPGGEWLLEIPASHAPALLRVLDMYILRDQVELQDRSSSHAWLALLGPRAGAVLAEHGLPRPEACGADGTVASAGGGALVLPSRLYGVPGFDLLVPAPGSGALRDRLVAAGAVPVELPALQIVRIEQGVPWFAEDLADNVIPLEAGLEVVARISNLGQVARKLLRLSVDWGGGEAPALQRGPLQATSAAEGGVLTSFAHDPVRRRSVALAYVRRAFWQPGTVLSLGGVALRVDGDARAGLEPSDPSGAGGTPEGRGRGLAT